MNPVPWSHVHDWICNSCGICCEEYSIVLKFDEWLRLVRNYGIKTTVAGVNNLYLNKKADGTCIFLYNTFRKWYCGLQNNKPLACKLWPFKILLSPKYGKPREALYTYRNKRFYVYLDPFCPQIKWGKPSPRIIYKIVPEFVDLALGLRKKQYYSTSTSYI